MDYIAELQKAGEEVSLAGKKYEEARVQAQLHCAHPKIVEGKYRPDSFVSRAFPPFRVCRDCGYSEEGWGAGYSFLTSGDSQKDALEIPEVERNLAYEFRRGRTLPNEVHRSVKLGKQKLEDVLRG